MSDPEFQNDGSVEDTSRKPLKPDTAQTKAAVGNVLQSEASEVKSDEEVIAAAKAFVEAPTNNPADIRRHLYNVGAILGDCAMSGEAAPAEVDPLHERLLGLFGSHHIGVAETELDSGPPDLTVIQGALAEALQFAKVLSSEYQNDALLEQVRALQKRIS